MGDDVEFRVGDVLTVSCRFAWSRVERLEYDTLALVWPWWELDPDSEFARWNGVVGLGIDASTFRWDELELFRTEPAPEQLNSGDVCQVGIPPTVVHVSAVDHFDPPLVTGYLPRPLRAVAVLPRGMSYRVVPRESHVNGTGYEIHPDDGIPYTFELIFRPYAFLEPGDELADTAGRAWRFDAAWDWYAFGENATLDAPTWPLTLLTRANLPCTPEAAAAVAEATRGGSHKQVLERWTYLTGAGPTLLGAVVPRLQ